MKRLLKLLLVPVFLFIGLININAATVEETQASINAASVSVNDFMSKVNSWATNNKEALKYLTKEEVANNISIKNPEGSIDYLISKLSAGGYAAAASSLAGIKSALINDINQINVTEALLYGYLDENAEYGIVGNLDVINSIKHFVNNAETNANALYDTLYDIYYADFSAKIETNMSVDDLIAYMGSAVGIVTKLVDPVNDTVNNWQVIYNKYITESYENDLISHYGSYKTKLDNGYNKLYNKAYSKFRARLEAKITVIENDFTSSKTTAIEHNEKLYDIIAELTKLKSAMQTNFGKLNSYVKITRLSSFVNQKEQALLNQVDSEIEYVKSFLIDATLIEVKNASDKPYFIINGANKLIIYKGDILTSANFISKLKTGYTGLEASNAYSGNIGTNSLILVKYKTATIATFTVVVRGDVSADAKISALDYVAIRNHIMTSPLITDNILKIAADYNGDEKISALDYVGIRNHIMSKEVI